jgi:EAL domain-containing protein (putative c-di-GMP-specific phosphodiesterase class I)
VSLVDGTIAGLEGLIRWRHPTRGLIPPAAFVPIAEETNAIIDIGRFVVARACADAARWNARGHGERLRSVSINLSPLQLADAGLPEFIATSIAASGIAPAQLGLEITESAVLDDNPAHAALLLELKRLGVQLVLDDFGTGYSSLSHLQRVPLACVKLDRSFVSGIGTDDRDTAIVVAVRQLARALGLVVIAEGVETADQVAALQGIGCELAQGYHFARPLERDQVDALLAADEPWRAETTPPEGDG